MLIGRQSAGGAGGGSCGAAEPGASRSTLRTRIERITPPGLKRIDDLLGYSRRVRSATPAGALIRNIADIIGIQTLRMPKRVVYACVAGKSPLTRIFGLRTGLVLFTPAKLGFQK
jgi:hypothetical protein